MIKRWGISPTYLCGNSSVGRALHKSFLGEPLWSIAQRGFKSHFPHHSYLMYLQQKATHSLGGFLRSLGGRRSSDFCEKLTFRENFSQKNFFKKFSNFPKNRLTKPLDYGIIEENQGGRPMDKIREELYTINRMLGIMSDWVYLTNEEKEMKKELEKRKKFLEFLIENA